MRWVTTVTHGDNGEEGSNQLLGKESARPSQHPFDAGLLYYHIRTLRPTGVNYFLWVTKQVGKPGSNPGHDPGTHWISILL